MNGAKLLKQAIQHSGISNRKFATCVLVVDESTVRRWLAGAPMPAVTLDFLERYVSACGAGPWRRTLRGAARVMSMATREPLAQSCAAQ